MLKQIINGVNDIDMGLWCDEATSPSKRESLVQDSRCEFLIDSAFNVVVMVINSHLYKIRFYERVSVLLYWLEY